MTPPPPAGIGIEAALDAIRADAEVWRNASAQLGEISSVIQSIRLEALHFSYIADKAGITSLYQGLQEKVGTLLGQGGANFGALSDALIQCAAEYEQADGAGSAELGRIQGGIPS